MPVLAGYGTPQRPYRPEHKPDPEQQDPSQLTALTPQNQSGRPLLRGNQGWSSSVPASGGYAASHWRAPSSLSPIFTAAPLQRQGRQALRLAVCISYKEWH